MGQTAIGNGIRPRPAAAWDLPIDYQKLRHGGAARWLRAAIYRAFVGREGWPLVFRPPAGDLPRQVSPNLYVHLPFCRQICPHCPYNKTKYDADRHAAYGEALRREMADYFTAADADALTPPPVQSLYFGGGTPSVTPDLIRMALRYVRPFLADGAEVGVEVHPSDATPQLLDDLREMGVNRVSLGVETFRADLLKQLGRTYSPQEAESAIRAAKAARFACVDVNLICAIPGQSHRDTADDARRCIALGVDQLSAYTLFTFVHTPFGRGVARRRLPVYGDVSRVRALWAISRVCRTAGFRRTSPWNYTRPGTRPYSTVTRESYVGFGAGASSKVDGVFSFNTFSVDAYVAQPKNRPAVVMEAGERFRRFHWLYWQLYKTDVDVGRYRALFGREMLRDFGPLFAILRLLGMARRERSEVRVHSSTSADWRVTELGAVWMHRMQQLFSITFIDDVWAQCQAEAWPKAVVLA
jgi:oxygen-independent coproporphyrinogen-3 oxidase